MGVAPAPSVRQLLDSVGADFKILQECITLCVFTGFAAMFLGEGLSWRYFVSFALVLGAVAVAFYR